MTRSSKSINPRQQKKNQSKPISQVRIIGGQFKRQMVPFIEAEGLRPSPDRLRETLFNWLQFQLNDATVLDLCAGSGVLGFEALSRGAARVHFIELQSAQARLIAQTADKLDISPTRYEVHAGDALALLATLPCNPVHIVFIDPPYDADLWQPLLNQLIENSLINVDTLLYIEDKRPLQQTLEGFKPSYERVKESKMGQVYASLIKLSV